MHVDLKHVNTVSKRLKDGSKVKYHYFRPTGAKIHGEYGSLEFLESYSNAAKSNSRRKELDLSWLIRQYLLSEKFSKSDSSIELDESLSETAQKDYTRMLMKIELEYGDLPIQALNEKGIKQELLTWRLRVAEKSGKREADNRISIFSAMLSWAVEDEEIPVFKNPIKGAKRLYKSQRSEVIWSPEAITKFMQHGCEMMQAAMILALHTAMRQGDLRALKWAQYDGTYIKYKPSKTKKSSSIIYVKCTPTLKNMLDSMERRSDFILCTKTGRQFKKESFGKYWRAAFKKAEIEPITLEDDGFEYSGEKKQLKLHFHDLRGTAVRCFMEAGCSDTEISMITGHKLKTDDSALQFYKGWSKVLADQAIDKFATSPNTQFANQLQTDFMKKGEEKLND